MKTKFKAYYENDEAKIQEIWENCIFTFDANVLLNLYRYSDVTVNRFFELLDLINEKIWLSYQAASEYHKNRKRKIKEQLDQYGYLRDELGNTKDNLTAKLNNGFDKHPIIDISKIIKEIETGFEKALNTIEKYEKKHVAPTNEDKILERITSSFENRVGNDFPDKRKTEIITEGELRYQIKRPPGYEDRKKTHPDKYGDLFFWFQVIEYSHLRKKDIVLVTDERKRDWWLDQDSEIDTPRPELINEFYEKTSKALLIYSTNRFIDTAKQFYDIPDIEKTVEEITDVKERDNVYVNVRGDINAISESFRKHYEAIEPFRDLTELGLTIPRVPLSQALLGMTSEQLKALNRLWLKLDPFVRLGYRLTEPFYKYPEAPIDILTEYTEKPPLEDNEESSTESEEESTDDNES